MFLKMHNYLDKLENKTGKAKIGKILFNKYYSIKNLYWTLFYTVSLSFLVGLGNAIPALGSEKMLPLVYQGFINNIPFSIFINLFYAKIIDKISNLGHLRRDGNILWAIVLVLFVLWHFIIGTENPIQANIMPGIVSLILTNYNINTLLRKKYSKL